MLLGRGTLIVAAMTLAVPVAVVTAATDPDDVESKHDVDLPRDPTVVDRIPQGIYTGEASWSFDGLVFSIAGDTLVLNGGSRGPVDLTVDDGSHAIGRFTFGGEWTMDVTIDGMTGTVEASTNSLGTLVGDTGALVATGTETTQGRMTFLGHTTSYTHVEPLPHAVLQIHAASCSEIFGTWEQAWQLVAGDIGYDNPENLTGTFWAIRTSAADDRQRIDDLFAETHAPGSLDLSGDLPLLVVEYANLVEDFDAFAAEAIATGTPIPPDTFWEFLQRAEELSKEVRNADPCSVPDEAARRIATVASRIVQAMITQLSTFGATDWSGADVRHLANKAFEHGVAGPRAQDPEFAELSTEFFRDWVVDTLNEHFDGEGLERNDDVLEALLIATAFDMTDLPVGDRSLHPGRTLTLDGDRITWVDE